MEGLCCILDSDEAYALRLTECLSSEKLLPLQIRTYSDTAAYISCNKGLDVELLIVEEALLVGLNLDKVRNVICLCEAFSGISNEGIPCVMKYQARDKVLREITALYTDMKPDRVVVSSASGVRMIAVYSPNGNCYKTTLAIMLAYAMGQKQKVLYVNLEEFSALGESLSEGQYNLSDALYFYHIGEHSVKLLSVINEGHGFDYISPSPSAEDLSYFTKELLLELIGRLVQLGGYEVVIMDVGSFVKQPWRLMEEMEYIYVPVPRGRHEERRLMEFKKYMHNLGNSGLVDKLIEVQLPYDENISKESKLNFSKAFSGVFGKVVQELAVQK